MKYNEKDEPTENFRELILKSILFAQETNRAEASLCSLSFQSTIFPKRHVWIDIQQEKIEIDLEEWETVDDENDVVMSKVVYSREEAIKLVQAWLCNNENSL